MDNDEFIKKLKQVAEIAPYEKHNPSAGYYIKKIKPITEVCSDCDVVVEDRVVEWKYYHYPKGHARVHCKNCKKIKHPITGKFELDNQHAQMVFTSVLRQHPDSVLYVESCKNDK